MPDYDARIDSALGIMPSEEHQQAILAHLKWELREILHHVGPDDLKPEELMAVLTVLVPAHARVLSGPLPEGGHRYLWAV
ncbi:hypothetical protein [Mycolicibacterium austroafricanum]|uniref:hypothetical protein n=1 Tax=Mycolicibacterium austroafricanum TaxID=39687 RepID=UPI001ABF8BA3|nr:hypothetical protein [Mycolicibacterium austroafricanum]QRZ05934.1 hypothetical protein JN090_23905 [Mycolicibacterium austroafricanum]